MRVPMLRTPPEGGSLDCFVGKFISGPAEGGTRWLLAMTIRCETLKNLLTDISGVRVGHADDKAVASGVTAVIFYKPAGAARGVGGGGPRTRQGAFLDLPHTPAPVAAPLPAGRSALWLAAGRRVPSL